MAVSKLLPMRRNDPATSTRAATALAWEEREAAAWRFLACWIVPSWLVFEIAPTKLVHYTLPMYPAFALMAGAAADHWFSTNEWKQGKWISAALFAILTLAMVLLATPIALDPIRANAAAVASATTVAAIALRWDDAAQLAELGEPEPVPEPDGMTEEDLLRQNIADADRAWEEDREWEEYEAEQRMEEDLAVVRGGDGGW